MATTVTETSVELESRLPTPPPLPNSTGTNAGEKNGIAPLPPLDEPHEPTETWRNPPINKYRLAAILWSFTVLGMNDGAPGALIPYIAKDYGLDYQIVALIFLSPFVGCIFSSLYNNTIHRYYGRRGVAILAAVCHIIGYALPAARPPYPVVIVGMIFAGIGNGCIDAAWNAFVGSLANTNELMGLLHGMYGIGAVISPIVVSAMVTNGIAWQRFFLIMIGLGVVSLVVTGVTFWGEDAEKYNRDHPPAEGEGENGAGRTRQALQSRLTYLVGLFLMLYVGVEVSLGGWIVTFMINERRGEAFASGLVSSGFWIGLTAGRFLLAWPTGRFGVKLMSFIYMVGALIMELLFWLVPQFHVSAVAVAFLGFFLGPLFPSAIVVTARLLPSRLHIVVIGLAAGIGTGTGSTVFPYIVGAIAQRKGVEMMHPLIVALLAVQAGIWLCLPRLRKKED